VRILIEDKLAIGVACAELLVYGFELKSALAGLRDLPALRRAHALSAHLPSRFLVSVAYAHGEILHGCHSRSSR